MSIVNQNYWDSNYKDLSFFVAPPSDEVRQWIEQFIIGPCEGRCLEIGCFPGRYLAIFGELGYELNGIDLTPRVSKDLPEWLDSCHYKIGTFTQADFTEVEVGATYDLVSSFGFIEHFQNWDEVLKKQAGFVGPGGWLVVTAPNFRGTVQRLLHRSLDAENYHRHFIPSMRPDDWAEIVSGLGFEVLFKGPFGRFDFWSDDSNRTRIKKGLLHFIDTCKPALRLIPENTLISPYLGLVARKRPNDDTSM